jgi:hypothetical protein
MAGENLRWVTTDEWTDLKDVQFVGAALQDVDLHKLAITQDQMEAAFGDGSMQGNLPDNLTWPAHWPTRRLPDYGENAFETQLALWRKDPAAYVPPLPPTAPLPPDHAG